MSRILIAGCGFVGTALADRLTSEGHDVWGLRRKAGDFPKGIHSLTADLSKRKSLGDLPSRLDFVFYAASADSSDSEAYRAAYVTGIENLVAALSAQNQSLKRFFFTSSTSVYGQKSGEWVDEESPTDPEHHTGQIMLEAERAVLTSPYPATVVRLGGIYGPGRRRLIERVRTGEATCSEGPPRYVNRIHRDDCAGALHHLMGLESPDPIYLAVDDAPAEECEVIRWLAEQLRVPPPRVVSRQNLSRRRGSSNKRCKNARLKATGYQLMYPSFREGYAEILARYP